MTKDLDILVTIYNHVYGMQIKAATAISRVPVGTNNSRPLIRTLTAS